MRIIVIGDQLVSGYGDPKGLGWLGRVAARTYAAAGGPVEILPLPMPHETTAELETRWLGEVKPRIATDRPTRLVAAPGIGDATAGITVPRSRLNLAHLLDATERLGLSTFVVGPGPVDQDNQDRVRDLSAAFSDVTVRRGVTYVDCYTPLVSHEQWVADMAQAPDGVTPGQAGHALIAWLVLHSGWFAWLGLSDTEE